MRRLAATAIAAACLAAVSIAHAAPPIPAGEPPTPGVYNPTIGVAGDSDASSIEKNPAGLGFLKSWSGVYLHSELDPAGTVGGRGDGFFFASPLPYLRSLAAGIAVQSIRPPTIFPYANEAKLSLSLAWRPLPGVALGFSYAHLWGEKAPTASGVDTIDLALSMRFGQWFALAMVVRDLSSPVVNGLPLQRVYDPELAWRPLGRDVLEIAAGMRIGERRGDIDPHFRLWIAPHRGLILKTDLEWKRDVDLDGKAENDIRVAIGLEMNLEHFGASAYGLFGSDSGAVRGHGFTVAARVSGERYPSFWRGPAHLIKIELGPGTAGRKLIELLVKLRRLERDPEVAGVVVVIGDLDGGWATAEELRSALLRLRLAHKHVFAFEAEVTSRGYYVASAAERIYQDPAGGVRLVGLASTTLFFKGAEDKLGIQADFVKIGEYKSAPEAFTRSSSTDPAREQREALVGDVYRALAAGLAADRKVSEAHARAWIDRGPYTAEEAERAGLVDELKSGDEIEDAIADRLGRKLALRELPRSPERSQSWARPQVAVLVVDGDIVDGKSATIPFVDIKLSGLQTLIASITRLREDARVRAIVLRVDSPGGSALASDLIARELERTRAVKPVVCSFGDTAASGGYFIAAPCERIFAAPSTLTGSIGIFSGKFDVSGLAGKLGVTIERYERGAHASIESMWRPYTDEERALILDKMRYFYGRFTQAVARGRGLTVEQVDALGRGRVWSGRAAQARGLVDEFGSVADAVADAARRAGLDERELPEVLMAPDAPTAEGAGVGGAAAARAGDRASARAARVAGARPVDAAGAPRRHHHGAVDALLSRASPHCEGSASKYAPRSSGNGLSTVTSAPLTGCGNSSRAACSAWRGSSTRSRIDSQP
jgi:protease-4